MSSKIQIYLIPLYPYLLLNSYKQDYLTIRNNHMYIFIFIYLQNYILYSYRMLAMFYGIKHMRAQSKNVFADEIKKSMRLLLERLLFKYNTL